MIQHVTREIPTAAAADCVAFYALLGFEQVQPPDSIGQRALWLEGGGTQVHLMPREDARPQSGHIGVVAASYEDTLARLRAAGHELDPRREHWGSPRCYVRDPAENLVEIMAWPPAPANASGQVTP